MKVCIVAEGCYPYVVGGVSGWINSMIKSFPNVEFIVLAIVSDRSKRGKFAYELPENLTEVHEVYLEDYDWDITQRQKHTKHLAKKDYNALRSMILGRDVNWDVVFELFKRKNTSINDLLMGPDFLKIAKECYMDQYPHIIFSDFLWTLRSIYLPMFFVLKMDVPPADVYHCVATGYAGVLGSMAQYFHKSKLLVSEHGIYTREREEELIKASWVEGVYKNIWIEQFKKMSGLAYKRADIVTCLYEHARELQLELGCPEEKIRITPNGIDVDGLEGIAGKTEEDQGYVNIGAVLRVAPIKDVKTMIQAYAYAKKEVPNLKLWIMGPYNEDQEYAEECFQLVEQLGVEDVVFTGRINVKEYLGRMDFTILTSISEGQPLTILESFAAKKPVIATDVGNCRELLFGTADDFGKAGILAHIMNIEEISKAMITLANDEAMRQQMGESGYLRVREFYQIGSMKQVYKDIYEEFAKEQNVEF